MTDLHHLTVAELSAKLRAKCGRCGILGKIHT